MSRLPNLGELYKVRTAILAGTVVVFGPPLVVMSVVTTFAVLAPLAVLAFQISLLRSTMRDSQLEAWALGRLRSVSES